VSAGGRVYVIGGWTTSSTVRYTQVDVFDPMTETWSRSVPLPEARGGAAAAVVDSVIYVMGGWTPANPASATVEAFDLRTQRWTRKASMPTARSATTATVLNGRVYVLGGFRLVNDVPEFTDMVESYNPATDAWRTEPSLPAAIAYGESVSLGDAIYLIGGRLQRTSASLASVWSLTPRR
jgi:N-acetylneuraminic acid mutarotase